MSKTVFILGAGASASAGAPVMANFLDVAERLMTAGEVMNEDQNDFRAVFRAINELERVYAKSFLDTENFESVFVAFEMAALLGRLGGLSESEVADLPRAMGRLITRTLDRTIEFRNTNCRILPPEPYANFSHFIKQSAVKDPRSVSVITFNYDVALDYALGCDDVPIDYALGTESAVVAVDVLKLHGSVSWGRDSKPGAPILTTQFTQWSAAPEHTKIVMGSDRLLTKAHDRNGGYHLPIVPIIVPPTWSKGEHHRKLQSVWRRAAQHIGEAEDIIVCGYSLPATDEFFRYLYAIGTIGPTRLKSFIVCDLFPNDALLERYQKLLGPKVKSRFKMARLSFDDVANSLAGTGLGMPGLMRAVDNVPFVGTRKA